MVASFKLKLQMTRTVKLNNVPLKLVIAFWIKAFLAIFIYELY